MLEHDAQLNAEILKFSTSSTQPRGGGFGNWVLNFLPSHILYTQRLSTPLFYAARGNYISMVQLLLSAEGSRNLEVGGGKYGSTPLHVASYYGHTQVVKILLDAGANVHEHNDLGERGINWAAQGGFTAIVEMLVAAGSRPPDAEWIEAVESLVDVRDGAGSTTSAGDASEHLSRHDSVLESQTALQTSEIQSGLSARRTMRLVMTRTQTTI